MNIERETRRNSYQEVLPKTTNRHCLIVELLELKPMTAHELTMKLLDQCHINYYDRNFVSPRLTELKYAGKVETIGKKVSEMTGRPVAVWCLKEESNDNC